MDDFFTEIRKQFENLKHEQHLLHLEYNGLGCIIKGKYCLFVEYQGEQFQESYQIEITINREFPMQIPIVRETSKKISRNYRHIYQNGELCLEIPTKISIALYDNPNLDFFCKQFVNNYFFSYLFFQKYKKFPFGDRSHGINGILEYYYEIFNVDNPKYVLNLLEWIVNRKYRGHLICPCGSGKKTRSCHGIIIREKQDSNHYSLFLRDYQEIKDYTVLHNV
jgi:hypothetical protein